jgi:hypothetical protein
LLCSRRWMLLGPCIHHCWHSRCGFTHNTHSDSNQNKFFSSYLDLWCHGVYIAACSELDNTSSGRSAKSENTFTRSVATSSSCYRIAQTFTVRSCYRIHKHLQCTVAAGFYKHLQCAVATGFHKHLRRAVDTGFHKH